MTQIRVLYDISILGYAHAFHTSRTGVFRVVEHGAKGLAVSPRCKVRFCTGESNFVLCNQYLAAQPDIDVKHVVMPDHFLSRVYTMLEPTRVKLYNKPSHPLKNSITRAIYNAGKGLYKPISSRELSEAQIYHSPHCPIPDHVFQYRNVVPFITVHDVIPLLCRDEASRSSVQQMTKVLSSIRPETFVLTVSQSTKNDLCNAFPSIDPTRIRVAHLAAGEQFNRCTDNALMKLVRQSCTIPEGVSYLLALSTIQPRKNFARTIRCFIKILQDSHVKDLYLVVVGAMGSCHEETLIEVERAGELRKRIIFTGFIADEFLAPLYSDAIAFLYPSIYEGFGLPPLEAMQCGTAVITSNTSSLPEVVGDAAIMVDPVDDDAICSAMLAVYQDNRLRSSLQQKGLKRAGNFSWEKYNKQVIDAYESAL